MEPADSEFPSSAYARYPAAFKLAVVRYAERYNNREAERAFGIAESNVRRWRKLSSAGLIEPDRDPMRWGFVDQLFASSDLEKVVAKEEMPQKTDSDTKPVSELQDDEVCLRWNSHHHNMKNMFPLLLKKEKYVDVTLTSEGKKIHCHKLILSSCSVYFESLLENVSPFQHAIIFLNNFPFWLLKTIVDFMYTGEVFIHQNKLQDLLTIAETLQVKGLTGKSNSNKKQEKNTPVIENRTQKDAKKYPSAKANVKSQSKNDSEELSESQILPSKKDVNSKSFKVLKLATNDSTPTPVSSLKFNEDDKTTRMTDNTSKESSKKIAVRKYKKRKSSELEPAPPILYRKGTKSRPRVKVPRYYGNDYEDLNALAMLTSTDDVKEKGEEDSKDECDLTKVKMEPIDDDGVVVTFTEIANGDGSAQFDSAEVIKPENTIAEHSSET